MTVEELARILWVRALEQCDPEGDAIRRRLRDRASLRARERAPAAPGDDDAGAAAFLLARADALLEGLADEGRTDLSGGWRAATRLPGIAWFLIAGFVAGCLAEGLTSRDVNLLAVPLLGLIVWNVAIYGFEVLRTLGGASSGAGLLGRALRSFEGWRARVAARVPSVPGSGLASLEARFLARASAAFTAAWLGPAGARAAALRPLRVRLHLAAAAFALGVIALLYAQGFAFAYRATWESTFLDAEAAAGFLRVALAPATAVGLGAPTVEGLAAIESPSGGPAAVWIHRWAVSLAAWVLLPRLMMAAGLAFSHARASAPHPDLSDAYYVRRLARRESGGRALRALPYAADPDAATMARLEKLVVDLFGERAVLRADPVIEYGEDPPGFADAAPEGVILLLPLAQTPEDEVHGRFVEDARAVLRGHPAQPPLLVVLDEAAFVERVGEERAAERRRAWQRVLDACGVEAVSLGSAGDEAEAALLEAAARELRPRASGGSA